MSRDPTHITSVIEYGPDDYAEDAAKRREYQRMAAIHGGSDIGMRMLNRASECAQRMRRYERRNQ
ncbi:MAG: hypothetical protein H0W48_00680 [Methylibium sp.]|nr:hypothetical protein [Methylibium sp.]